MSLTMARLTEVFFCTGARNQELLKFFPQRSLRFEYDERMASFKALGLAKLTGAPVVVCTTSGTAVSECLSALIEARYSKVPLVLITGDRPKKLHGTGSPQTIDHEALTRSCRGSFLEVTLEEFADLHLEAPQFPVHINVLVDDTCSHEIPPSTLGTLSDLEKFLKDKHSPLFLFSHEEISMRPFIEAFKERGLPFYAETLSGARDLSNIQNERHLLKLWKQGHFDSVIRVGHTPLSKIWRLLEKEPLPVFHVDSRGLAALSYGKVLRASSTELLGDQRWWDILPSKLKLPEGDGSLLALLDRYPDSEPAVMSRLEACLDPNDIVYLGNSLVIRFFELVQNRAFEVYGNRGVNGIDGQLSTAIGIALGTPRRVVCVLGDITTMYDLSALAELPANLKLVIVNNKGGRIFDMLQLDKRIVLEHERDFENIAKGLSLSYSRRPEDLGHAQVIELGPDRNQSEEFLREWKV